MTQLPEQLGPYTIDRELGRGGMGVVYLGHDTRLDRAVAIKALPETFASDPDRLARFEREARTLAALNNPNVAGIFGVEEFEGRKHLVLEYVEGETLGDWLDRGPLPVHDALEIAIQIASGIEAAHEAGVIHRDLKPANIKITPDGRAKVLDFGLARSETMTSTGSSVSQLPTMTSPLSPNTPTMAGAVLGTAPYMSPEQARGRTVDKRTDIWSFGVLLYECLTGSSPFVGETATDSIGAILHKDVDLDRLPADTPERARHLIDRCLQRDKRQRIQAIGDARIELEQALAAPTRAGAVRTGASPVRWALVLLAIILAGAAGFFIERTLAPSPAIEGALHVSIPIGRNTRVDGTGAFEFSPTSRTIAYVAIDPEDDSPTATTAIFVRDLSEPSARRLAGTEDVHYLRFSPDGTQLAFVWFDPESDREEVRRVSVDGGPALTVYVDRTGGEYSMAEAPLWLSDEEIVAFSQDRTTLSRVSIATGAFTEFATIPHDDGWVDNGAPARLDETSILMSRARLSQDDFSWTLFRVDLATGELTKVLDDAVSAQVLPSGRLVFLRRRTLCAAPFDIGSATVTGPVTPLISGVLSNRSYSLSPRGDLLVARGSDDVLNAPIVAIDREGEQTVLSRTDRDFNGSLSLSADGRLLALSVLQTAGPPEVHTVDLETGFVRPVYPSGRVTIAEDWLPDGRLSFLNWFNTAHGEIVLIDPATESSAFTPLPEPDGKGMQDAPTFTPDSRYMIFEYETHDESLMNGIYMVDLEAEDIPASLVPIVATSALERAPSLSPNGALLAYTTDASGKEQVVLEPFSAESPEAPGRVYPVSFDGGSRLLWGPDGTELFFVDPERINLMSVSITTEPSLSISPPRVVLTREQATPRESWGDRPFEITPDGERFIYVRDTGNQSSPMTLDLILDWFEEHPEFK